MTAPTNGPLAATCARRSHRLERQLADAFVTAFPMGGLPQPSTAIWAEPRLLDLGELEVVRDELTRRLHEARTTIARRADEQEESRLLLERMLLEPGRYRFARVSCDDLGEPGCGVWQVRPRLGLDRDADGVVAGQALLRLSVSRGSPARRRASAILIAHRHRGPACARC